MSDNGPAVNISLEQVEAFIKLLSPAIAKTLRSNPTGLEEHWSPGLPTSKQMRRIFELGPRSSEHSPNSFLHYTQEQTSRPDGFHDSLQFINGTVRTIQHRKTTVVPHAGFIITLTYKYEDN